MNETVKCRSRCFGCLRIESKRSVFNGEEKFDVGDHSRNTSRIISRFLRTHFSSLFQKRTLGAVQADSVPNVCYCRKATGPREKRLHAFMPVRSDCARSLNDPDERIGEINFEPAV